MFGRSNEEVSTKAMQFVSRLLEDSSIFLVLTSYCRKTTFLKRNERDAQLFGKQTFKKR